MKKLLISIILCIGTHLYAQTIEKFSIDSGGASKISGNLEILYTIGEVNLQEYNVNSLYVSEGFIDNFIIGSLGEEEFSLQNLFRIYPNPVSEIIHIKTNNPLDNIEIYNILGDKVLKTTEQKIDVSNLHSGLYLIKIYSGNRHLTKKIVIK